MTSKVPQSWKQIAPMLENTLSLIGNVEKRHSRGATVADDNTQAMDLIKLSQNHFLDQIIKHNTRMNNILDLMFVNDDNLISDQEVIDNVLKIDEEDQKGPYLVQKVDQQC